MPRFKSLLVSMELRPAGRLRSCKHDTTHQIVKGAHVLEVRTGLRGRAGYCQICAKQMIEDAEKRLAALRAAVQ